MHTLTHTRARLNAYMHTLLTMLLHTCPGGYFWFRNHQQSGDEVASVVSIPPEKTQSFLDWPHRPDVLKNPWRNLCRYHYHCLRYTLYTSTTLMHLPVDSTYLDSYSTKMIVHPHLSLHSLFIHLPIFLHDQFCFYDFVLSQQ